MLILEKSTKLLSKVLISGGGRCNVTHHCYDAVALSRHYPRGQKALRSVFKQYQAKDTVEWFASRNVMLKAEPDGRMFPVTDSSRTIVDCFLKEASRLGIKVETRAEVTSIEATGDKFRLATTSGSFEGKRVLVTTGGNPKAVAYHFIRDLGHTIVPPVPSLFTFNDVGRRFADLMGVSVPDAVVRIAGTKFLQSGPLLITHWGLSGPAVIRLSAWAAEHLHAVDYTFTVLVSWFPHGGENETRRFLLQQKADHARRKIHSHALFGLPQRLWEKICMLAEIPEDKVWGEVSNRQMNKLLEFLIRCPFQIKGKTTFKEEFVTCGGVDLAAVNLETMESKIVRGLYFAGEVLNLDGETGGFNFQAAWSTAFLAASSMFRGR